MSEDYVTVMMSRTSSALDFYASVLRAQGIDVSIKGEHFTSFLPNAALLGRGVELQVHENDVERALEILDDPELADLAEEEDFENGDYDAEGDAEYEDAEYETEGEGWDGEGEDEASAGSSPEYDEVYLDDYAEDAGFSVALEDDGDQVEVTQCPNCGSENIYRVGRRWWDWAELLLTVARLGARPPGPAQWCCRDCQWDWEV